MTRKLLRQEGIYCGGSAGGAVVGAIRYAKTLKEPKKILVILPDSGNRYTSKIFNDDWMRDNEYRDTTFNVTIEQFMKDLGRYKEPLITIEDTATVGDAIELMNRKKISQLPVFSKNEISGMVNDKDLVRPVLEGEVQKSDSISLVCNSKFKLADKNDLLSNITGQLLNKEPILVTDNGKVFSIITDIDILKYLSEHESNI